jgi:hypothetical protein
MLKQSNSTIDNALKIWYFIIKYVYIISIKTKKVYNNYIFFIVIFKAHIRLVTITLCIQL